MKYSKRFKFINLVMIFICISSFLATIPVAVSIRANDLYIFTSYMHENKLNIENEFYKSMAFDNNLMSYLAYVTSGSAIDLDDDSSARDKGQREYSRQELEQLKNLDYFIINNDTDEIYTNTNCKTTKEFEDKYKGECDVKLISKDNNISYSKTFNNKEYKNSNVNNVFQGIVQLKNSEICMSIPKNFQKDTSSYDDIYMAKENFNRNINNIKIILTVLVVSLILGIISTILYKRSKVELFEKDSFWLKLSKFIPLELYTIGLFIAVSIIVLTFEYDAYILENFIFAFLCIGFILTVLYIFDKQFKSYDNKMDFFKSTLVYRVVRLFRDTFLKLLKLTRNMPLSKRILGIWGICIIVIILGLFIYSPIWLLSSSIISISIFAYYILKKLWYLSYIIDGTERIKNGDVHHKLKLIGEDNFTTLAENINNIRDGLDEAIENQLKSGRMKSELITNVSHDLKTPLTSIINYVQLIKKEENITPEYIKDYVNILDSKSKRLKILIEDLFEASKASSGNIELNMEKIDIIQLLRQSIGEMEEKLSESNLNLKISVPEEKVYVKADGRRLYRVLENLLSNISKYSLPNTRVYIDIVKEADKIKVIMKNISSYELNFDPEEIMERFKRADESRNTEGSGLGLAIARDLVNIQGGTFSIDIDGDLFKSIIEFDEII